GEGYVKGVHDRDGAKILQGLVGLRNRIGLLRYSTQARAQAVSFWALAESQDEKRLLAARIAGIGQANRLFGPGDVQQAYIEEAREQLENFVKDTQLFSAELLDEAAEYLFWELAGDTKFTVAKRAVDLRKEYESYLRQKRSIERFSESIEVLSGAPVCRYRLMRDWVRSYLLQSRRESELEYCDEVAGLLLIGDESRKVCSESIECELAGMVGSHKILDQGRYLLNYCHFMSRLGNHERTVVPQFTQYQKCKSELIERFSDGLHLEQFRPRVLTTFVRNRLIDQTYLPLIGDNLAKQVGAEGEQKRTDRQGLLLLISPPGYGKTTLMEYVANRLGLIFMKINAPALGNKVTSLDPAEAANAAAREELRKLNLAFEMGDNIMVYIDDIQHSNPEFLQKFISLCDAQRKIEGIYGGRSRTYDLRGKRVCVVMAGNPYTESGQKFRIPDMLANRADVYNIGDIVGNNYEQFVNSYIENCLTSNPVLEKLARRSQSDVSSIMKIAETGREEGIEFEGNYSVEEIKEYVSTMKKLYTVREVVLKVNQEYIRSAGQADEYRTEPSFLLQGSYRNMNRIAARVLPVMNDDELWTLIYSAYEQDAQTLTTGAESNLLKFRELTGRLSTEQAERWEDIRKTFRRNLLLGGDSEDNVGKIIRQLNAFSAGLDSIRDVIAGGLDSFGKRRDAEPEQATSDQIKAIGQEVLDRMAQLIAEVKQSRDLEARQSQVEAVKKTQKDTRTLISVLEEQFRAMETWLLPMAHGDKKSKERVVKELMRRFETMVEGYNRLIEVLKNKYQNAESPRTVSKPSDRGGKSRPVTRKKQGEDSAHCKED
ncbi:MAG: ATP-binding protein, partial [Planctomycetota bacterium]